MIPISVIFWLLITHWVADFVLQTDWMARNKSKSNLPLSVHVLVYTLGLIPFAIFFINPAYILWFLIFNYCAHWYIDYNTSRITSRLGAQGKYGSNTVPNFGMFSIIGLDQLFHYLTLFFTYLFFTNP